MDPAHRGIPAEPIGPARATSAASSGAGTLRNLVVELRQGDEQQLSAHDVGLRGGSVSVGGDGVRVQAQGAASAGRRDAQGDVVQRLMVVNGGQGRIAIGSGAPVLEWHQLAWSAAGPVVVGTRRWVEAVRSMSVRPSWPGGDAPVTVELRAEDHRPAAGAGVAQGIDGASVLTTVQLPLGQWVTVASSAQTSAHSESGVLSQRRSTNSQRHVVQLRVNLP